MSTFHPRFWFGRVDSRPLSVFRVFFAALLLKDAIYHFPLAEVFYSDTGYVPRSALWEGLARPDRFSIMDAMPYSWMATVFFVFWAGVALCLLVGFHTRLMVVLNFVMVLSIHERNIYVLNGADTVVRVVSFWILFLPLGRHYSVDALRARCALYTNSRRLGDLRVRDVYSTTFAFPLRALQLQIAIIYLFTFIEKLQGNVWQTGDAMHYALQIKSLTLPTGDLLLAASPPWLLSVLSYFTLLVEGTFPFLVFAPFWRPGFRAMGLLSGILLHLGIAATMSIGNFSLVMIVCYIVFCDSRWLLALGRQLRGSFGRSYVALHPLGSPMWLVLGSTREREIRVDSSRSASGDRFDNWEIFSEKGELYTGFRAWVRLSTHFPLGRFAGWTFRSKLVRVFAWKLMHWWARRLALPQPEGGTDVSTELESRDVLWFGTVMRVGISLMISILMLGVVWSNLPHLVKRDDDELAQTIPRTMARVIKFTGLWQRWNLFAPYPMLVDGWVVVPGKFEDGAVFDLRSGHTVNDNMQRWFWGPDARWKKYERNLSKKSYRPLYFAWAARYCREYNTHQGRPEGQRLATLELQFRHRYSHDPGGQPNLFETRLLWKHWCYSKYEY